MRDPQRHRPSLRSKLLWIPQARGQELCQQSEGAFPSQASRWECSPAASLTTASDTLNRGPGRCAWTPYHRNPQMINVHRFKTFNLLCSKRKLIHSLEKRMLSTWPPLTSSCKQTTAPNLLPGRTGCCSGVHALHFHWQEALKQKLLGALYTSHFWANSYSAFKPGLKDHLPHQVRLEIIREDKNHVFCD